MLAEVALSRRYPPSHGNGAMRCAYCALRSCPLPPPATGRPQGSPLRHPYCLPFQALAIRRLSGLLISRNPQGDAAQSCRIGEPTLTNTIRGVSLEDNLDNAMGMQFYNL